MNVLRLGLFVEIHNLHSYSVELYLFSVYPLPCLHGCVCYYSLHDEANTMDCSYQGMVDTPREVLPLTEKLIMSGNHMRLLENINKNLTKVKQFDFENNSIRHIGNKATKTLLWNVNTLNLVRNKLTKLPILFQASTKIQFWLGQNPYECNCNMMWLRDWLQNATNVVDKENITCGDGKWKGKCLIEL